MVFPKNKSSDGNALIAVMMLAGISAGISANLSNIMDHSFQSLNSARIKIEREGIAHILSEELDCKSSLSYTAAAGAQLCSSAAHNNNIIVLKGINGSNLGTQIADQWHKVSSDWKIRAKCQYTSASARGLMIEAAKINADGTYQKDPLTDNDLYFPDFMDDIAANKRRSPCSPLFKIYTDCDGIDRLAKNIDFADLASPQGPLKCSSVVGVEILNSAVEGVHIADHAISSAKIANETITNLQLADLSVLTNKIAPSAVETGDIADFAVAQSKMSLSAAIAGAKIASGAVMANKIADNAVTSVHIVNGSIGGGLIKPNAVTTAVLGNASVGSSHIANSSLVVAKIQNGQVYNEDIQAGSINSNHIIDGNILERHLPANAVVIRNTNLANNAINAANANRIAAGNIITRHITQKSITGDDIALNSVSFSKLATPCTPGASFKYTNGQWQCSNIIPLEVQYCPMGALISGTSGNPASFQMRFTSNKYNTPAQAVGLPLRAQDDFMHDNGQVCDWKRTQQIGGGGGWQFADDWVGCNAANGWKLIGCTRGDDQVFGEDILWEAIRSNRRYFFDDDIDILGDKCVTNDWHQHLEWIKSGSQPNGEARTMGLGMVAVCMKTD